MVKKIRDNEGNIEARKGDEGTKPKTKTKMNPKTYRHTSHHHSRHRHPRTPYTLASLPKAANGPAISLKIGDGDVVGVGKGRGLNPRGLVGICGVDGSYLTCGRG